MKIIAAGDSAFLKSAGWMNEQEFSDARRGSDLDVKPEDLSVEHHEAWDDARRLGFRTMKDSHVFHPPRIYKVDRGVTTNILNVPHTGVMEEDEGPQWMSTMHGFEYPEIRAMHNSLEDALEAHRTGAWKGNHKKLESRYEYDEMKEHPGTWYLTRYDSSVIPFQEAWDRGTDDPYDIHYRRDMGLEE